MTAGERSLAEAKVQRGIFQGDALSLLLFIIAMMPLNYILRKFTARCKLSKSQENINHLLYMDGVKLFAKNGKELENLMNAVKIYRQDIGMEFGIEKYSSVAKVKPKNDTWRTEWRCKIKTRLERSEKRKPTNTWASWKLIPSNNGDERKN